MPLLPAARMAFSSRRFESCPCASFALDASACTASRIAALPQLRCCPEDRPSRRTPLCCTHGSGLPSHSQDHQVFAQHKKLGTIAVPDEFLNQTKKAAAEAAAATATKQAAADAAKQAAKQAAKKQAVAEQAEATQKANEAAAEVALADEAGAAERVAPAKGAKAEAAMQV